VVSEFDHLRSLPDGSLTRAEVDVLLRAIDQARADADALAEAMLSIHHLALLPFTDNDRREISVIARAALAHHDTLVAKR
jgi:hypothetical protein